MGDLAFWSEILKTYGIGAIFGFLFFRIFQNVISHYMKTIDRNSSQSSEMAKDFTKALNANAEAIHNLAKVHQDVGNTMHNVSLAFDRNAAQNSREHGDFFKLVQGGR